MITYNTLLAKRGCEEMRKFPHELQDIQILLYSYSESDKECNCASARHTEMYTKKEFVHLVQNYKKLSVEDVQNTNSEDSRTTMEKVWTHMYITMLK